MFTRRQQYKFSIPKEHLKYHLLGNHITIHHRDFDVLEDEHALSIQPRIEDNAASDTLPITHVELREQGNITELLITSTMPRIQAGGQMVIMIFCILFVMASFLLLFIGRDPAITISLCAISLLVFILFLIRLQLGYFGYVRKIRAHIRSTAAQITADVRRQIFKHKVK